MSEVEQYKHLLADDGDLTAESDKRGVNISIGRISFLGTAANIVKAVVGSGILSVSWSFLYSTMWPAVAFTMLMGMLSAVNFAMLGHCSRMTGLQSYSDIWGHCFGERSAVFIDLTTFLFTFATSTSYLIVIGDYVPLGLHGLGIEWAPLQNRYVAIVSVAVLILPLNFLKDMSVLGYTSIIGVLGGLYTCVVLVIASAEVGTEASDWSAFAFKPGWFLMIPTVTFSFNGHFNAPEVYQQLKNPSPNRWLAVVSLAFGVCFLVVLGCGVSGYLMFGSELALPDRSNLLTAPSLQGKKQIMVSYIATTFSVTFSIPIYYQSLRRAMTSIWLKHSFASARALGERLSDQTLFNLLSVVCIASTLGLSMLVDSLGLLNSINGAVCACLMMFVFPSLMYMKCTDEENWSSPHWWFPRFSIMVGVIAGASGVVTAILLVCGNDLGVAVS